MSDMSPEAGRAQHANAGHPADKRASSIHRKQQTAPPLHLCIIILFLTLSHLHSIHTAVAVEQPSHLLLYNTL